MKSIHSTPSFHCKAIKIKYNIFGVFKGDLEYLIKNTACKNWKQNNPPPTQINYTAWFCFLSAMSSKY